MKYKIIILLFIISIIMIKMTIIDIARVEGDSMAQL